jgi:hypothetical protein
MVARSPDTISGRAETILTNGSFILTKFELEKSEPLGFSPGSGSTKTNVEAPSFGRESLL